MHDLATFVRHDNEAIEQPESGGWDNEEVTRRRATQMVAQKRHPRLTRPSLAADSLEVSPDRPFRDFKAELHELAVNPRRPPQGIGLTHGSDEIPYGGIDGGTSESLRAAFPGPIQPEALPVPTDDGLGLNNEESLRLVTPDS